MKNILAKLLESEKRRRRMTLKIVHLNLEKQSIPGVKNRIADFGSRQSKETQEANEELTPSLCWEEDI